MGRLRLEATRAGENCGGLEVEEAKDEITLREGKVPSTGDVSAGSL